LYDRTIIQMLAMNGDRPGQASIVENLLFVSYACTIGFVFRVFKRTTPNGA
jgi:hypothetical protein